MTGFTRILVCIGLCMSMGSAVVAQEVTTCGTPAEISKWTEDYLSNRQAFQKNNNLLYVPLVVHIVGTNEGDGYVSVNSLLNALCTLNEDFAPGNIQFYMDGNIRYINRTDYYDHTSTSTGNRMHSDYRVSNALNFYIVLNAANNSGYATGIGGSGVIVRKAEITSGNHTLAHEIGHALGLYHTFFGWEAVPEPNYTENAPNQIFGRLVERVDGSNCDQAADGFCDTSPDYLNERWNCDADGLSTVVQKDPSGQSFKSDGTNIMSYSLDRCITRFSDGQVQAMRSHLQSAKSSYLNRAQPATSINEVTSAPITPSKGETVDYNSVFLQWEPLPEATSYILEVSILGSFPAALTQTYYVNTNSATITGLNNNRTYHWRIKGYNRNSFCTKFSASSTFKTTDMTTSVNNLDEKSIFEIFPNPLSEGQTLNIRVTTSERTDLTLRMLDVSGKLIQTSNYEVLAGESTLKFTPTSVAKGMYFLNFTTARGNSVQRVMIQ